MAHRDGRFEITATEIADPAFTVSAPQRPVISKPLPVVAFSRIQTDPKSRYLYHKTTMRKIYNDARELAAQMKLFEILFTNTKDEVTEGSITNLFIKKDGLIFTPPLRCGVLNGIFRQFLLNQEHAQERILLRQDIDTADAVYAGNSVRGLVQVTVQPEQY
jgi:para-aminobenzoate synthetase/4-amino-4-deoxychorismate lyase